MAGGIGGFAEGFSGGLGQGMGILSQVRADKRADEYMDMQKQSMAHSQKIQDAEEARAQTTFSNQQEDRDWNNKNIRPLTLQQAQLAVNKYQQDIALGGVDLATKNLMLGWLPEDHALDVEFKKTSIQTAKNADRRANASLADQLQNSALNRRLAVNQDSRANQAQSIQLAGAVLPVYTEMLSRGIQPPQQMVDIISHSPFGMAQQIELANASKSFPTILQKASQGDFSFMKDPDMAESAQSLARPVGMRVARELGFDPTSARVVGMTPYKTTDGKLGMYLDVMARDPKTGQYRQVRHGVLASDLAQNMELSARSGAALAAHPAYQQMQQALPGYLGALGVTSGSQKVREAAGQGWDKQMSAYQKIIETGDDSSPAYKQAQTWIEQNGNRDDYVRRVTQGAIQSQNVRGDASPSDWGRVSSTVSKFTGLTDPGDVSKRANGALAIMKKLTSVPHASKVMPGISRLVQQQAHATGKNFDDPAFNVQLYYMIQGDPKLRGEMANALMGGSGKSRPSTGGVTPNAKPISNAPQAIRSVFPEAHVTSWKRGAGDGLTQANPNSWHAHSGAAVDVRPIPGVSFERFISGLREAGYKIIEQRNEVTNPSAWATGPHWHVVLGH